MRCKTVLLCIVLLASGLYAETKTFDPAARAKAIAPFVDEQTILVAHVDLRRIDVEAIWDKITSLIGETLNKNEVKPPDKEVRLIADLIRAGVTDVYFVVSLADIPPEPMLVVVPLGKGADAWKIRSLLYSGKLDGPTAAAESQPATSQPTTGVARKMQTVVLHNAVVFTRASTIQRLKTLKPDPRPEMEKAFAAAGDTAVQVLVLPTDDTRRVIEELMPELPEIIGGGPSTKLTQGLLWGAVGINSPPKMLVYAVAQSRDAESAKAFQTLVPKIAHELLTTTEVAVRSRVTPAGEWNKNKSENKAAIERLTRLTTAKVTGNRVTLTLEGKNLDTILEELLAPPLRRARQLARQTVAMNNMRQIVLALHMYADDHNRQWPESLDVLVEKKYLPAKLLESLEKPAGKKIPLAYLKPDKPMGKLDPMRSLVYQSRPGGDICGFVDGHIEFISPREKERFEKLLSETKAGRKKPAK